MVAIGAFAFLGAIFTPENAGRLASAIYPVVGGAMGAVVGFGIIYLICLIKAPYRQRDEARVSLQAKPKTVPLQNRKELIEAVATVENTTLQLVNCQNAIDTNSTIINAESYARRDEAYEKWNQSMNELRRQYLVAGDEYEKIAIDFTGFVGLQIMSKMGQLKYPEDTKPVVLQDTLKFAGVLASRVKETIRKINELSGQAPYKEGSQTELI